jgi:hypothetical protein
VDFLETGIDDFTASLYDWMKEDDDEDNDENGEEYLEDEDEIEKDVQFDLLIVQGEYNHGHIDSLSDKSEVTKRVKAEGQTIQWLKEIISILYLSSCILFT